ncbi:BlaI/MecI/CopY family transcriptional regulator [Christensenella intestinihominis]|uniref:BlaI/MecI/CopY family transcriptional regulator n=1 Tax=Christensenella intestinihominis TaxID=1851429 RepID=UPI00082F050B|nr:BlaI/MecI/CopY family transcriptional regulator [Christensenella intestinihominis]
MTETLTYREWMVMNALWGRDPQPLSGVIEAMGETVDWSYRTYASYLKKLCDKGFVGFEAKGRDKFYYPLVQREDCIRAESRSLLKKVSSRSRKDLLLCMIEESGLRSEDQAELKSLIDRLGESK